MFLVVFVEASPKGSLFLHLIDCAPIALPQELPRRLVLLGAPLLLQQGTGNGRDLLIIRDEPLWAKAYRQRTPLPPRFPTPEISKTSQFGGLMHVLPTRQQFLWPILSHKKVFDHQILPLYSCCLPTKKTFQRTPGRSRLPGPPLGVPRGPAAALGHLQVDEMPSLPWRGRRARSTRRA